MPYEYLEEGVTSDVTFRAWGGDLNQVFREAADATVNVMVASLDSIRPLVRKRASLAAERLDILLWRFLDEIIFYKDADGLILRAVTVVVETLPDGYRLQAKLAGETIAPERHERLADVKAATLFGLTVERVESGWRAQVTLDV